MTLWTSVHTIGSCKDYLNYYETMRLTWTYLRPFMVLFMLWITYALDLDYGPWTIDIGLKLLLITLINFNYKD